MNIPFDFIEKNKESWNKRTPYHIDSEFYDQNHFKLNPASLTNIELGLLGDIQNKKILHLQCHFGQDSISLAKLGADVTAVDFSNIAINEAKKLAVDLKLEIRFIACNIYDLSDYLDDTFDIIYTSYGTIVWLPDLIRWGEIISKYLKPEGRFIFVEFHPLIHMFNEEFTEIKYDYFNIKPIVELEHGTYADRTAPIHHETITWNHSLSDILTALIKNNLTIEDFKEYDFSPYNCFHNLVEVAPKEFQFKNTTVKWPLVFSLSCIKK